MSKKKKAYELPVEEGPGEGLEDPWWEDDLLNEPPIDQPEEPTDTGYSEAWSDDNLLEDDSERWEPDDENLDGYDDVGDWDPLIEGEDMVLPAAVPVQASPVELPPDPDSSEEEESLLGDKTEPLPEFILDDPIEPWELKVISWAPTVTLDGRSVAATCSTASAATELGTELKEGAEGEVVHVQLDIEGRVIDITAVIREKAGSCVVLGRDALAQARLVVDPAQN